MIKRIFILTFILFSCSISNGKMNESCINDELDLCIKNYIKENEFKMAIYDENDDKIFNIYFFIYFFNEDTNRYFTIWESFYPKINFDKFISQNKLNNKTYLYKIMDRDVYFINGTNEKDNLLFSCYEKNKVNKFDVDENNLPIYDGSLYPLTYKYYLINNKIIIEKLDTVLLNFSDGWPEYEGYIKEKQKDGKNKNY